MSVKNIKKKHDEIETRIIRSWSVGLRLPMTYIRSRERNTWQGSQWKTGHRQDLNIPGAGFRCTWCFQQFGAESCAVEISMYGDGFRKAKLVARKMDHVGGGYWNVVSF